MQNIVLQVSDITSSTDRWVLRPGEFNDQVSSTSRWVLTPADLYQHVSTPGEGEDQVTLSSTFLSLLLLFLPSFSFSPSLSFSLALPLISLFLSPFMSLPSSYSVILTNIPAEPGWEQQVKKKGGKINSQSEWRNDCHGDELCPFLCHQPCDVFTSPVSLFVASLMWWVQYIYIQGYIAYWEN